MTSLKKILLGLTFLGMSFINPTHIKPEPKPKVAVAVVDMQEDFLRDIAPDEIKREVSYQLNVLDYAKERQLLVYELHTVMRKHIIDNLNEELKEYEIELLQNLGFGKTEPRLKRKLDHINSKLVRKYDDNGFIETSLATELREQGIEYILLMGINACACVKKTGQGAIDNGFKIMTLKELIASSYTGGFACITDDGCECTKWYARNGIYKDDYKDLLEKVDEILLTQ